MTGIAVVHTYEAGTVCVKAGFDCLAATTLAKRQHDVI